MKKTTDDLAMELMNAPKLDRFLNENEASFRHDDVAALVETLRKSHRMSKSAFAKGAAISSVYLYQILSGMRRPTRDKLICLLFSAQAGEAEAQELLKHAGYAQLYPANRRDAILLYGIAHGMSLLEVNEALFNQREETLF